MIMIEDLNLSRLTTSLSNLSDASRAMVLQGHSIKSQSWSTGVWGGEDSLHSVFHKEGGSHHL